MAAIHDLPAGALQKLSAEFLTGGHTRLWEGWGAADVVPGYNKLYYLRQAQGLTQEVLAAAVHANLQWSGYDELDT